MGSSWLKQVLTRDNHVSISNILEVSKEHSQRKSQVASTEVSYGA